MRSLADDFKQPHGVDLVIENHVAHVTINRPDDTNRLTPATLKRLAGIAAELASDSRTSCVVISGAGSEFFSSGIFNIQLRAAYSKQDALAIVRLANEAFDAIEMLPQIVIGALNGAVRAGGGELALACDFRLAAPHATLAFHETSYACFPGAGAPMRLQPIVGRGQAIEIMATGREIDAREMERLGIINSIVPADGLLARAREIAEGIAAKGPLGPRGIKSIINVQSAAAISAAKQHAWALRCALEYSADVDEAILAHKEGRAARYLGR